MAIKKRKPQKCHPKKPPFTNDNTPPIGPTSEFRNADDDAWYSVNMVLYGETLVVKYREFRNDGDEEYHAKDFKTLDEITAFGVRFRPLSKQLEGCDCGIVEQGMRVCALRVFAEDDHRFYDAIVEAVKHEEHTVMNGEEKCMCSFVLSWLHGPEAGTLASASIEDLCPIQSRAHVDLRLICFLEIAKWKHGITSPSFELLAEEVTYSQESPISSSKDKPLCVIQRPDSAVKIDRALLMDEEVFQHESDEDVDLGGGCLALTTLSQTDLQYSSFGGRENPHVNLIDEKASGQRDEENGQYSTGMEQLVEDVSYIDLERKTHAETNVAQTDARYFIFVENLEKEVSPSTIVDFVREVTSLEINALVFSSLTTEPYTRGALGVNSTEELGRLCDFVTKPDQMITSSKGRPWIVSESSESELFRTSFWCLEPDLKNGKQQSAGNELKVVQLGSEEYSKAEKLRDLFLEFAKHQERLLKRLTVEEQNILDS